MEHFDLRSRRQSSDFHHFSGPSEYVHRLHRIETHCSRMQNSPAIFAAAKCQISEIAGPNPTSHNTCTGCRESHQAALVHAPCALSRINRTHRRHSRDHERASDGVCSAANLDTYADTHTDTGADADADICRYRYRCGYSYSYRCRYRYRYRYRYSILDIGCWMLCNDCALLLTWILDNETDTDTDVLGRI